MRYIVLTTLYLILTMHSFSQDDPRYVKFEEINRNVSILSVFNQGSQVGANITIYDDKVSDHVLINTNLKHDLLFSLIHGGLEGHLLGKMNINSVFIAHWHPDHSGNICKWSNISKVISHSSVFRTLNKEHIDVGLGQVGQRQVYQARSKDELPTHTFEKE